MEQQFGASGNRGGLMEAKRGHVTPTNSSGQVTVEEVLQSTPRAIRRAGCPQAEWLGGASTKVESKMAPCQGVPGSYPAGTGEAGWGTLLGSGHREGCLRGLSSGTAEWLEGHPLPPLWIPEGPG